MRDSIFKIFLFCFFPGVISQAQISVGLKESALGNSGVAFTDSSAPSHYNPALLSERSKSYFSLTGTTLSNFKSDVAGNEFNSTKFSPNYLSSIQSFGTYVHEFSLVNQLSLDTQISTPIQSGTQTTAIATDSYNLAYSFAFKDFSWGFQLGLRINESKMNLNQRTNDGNVASGVDVDTSSRTGHLFAGFGGVHQLGSSYRLGYKYETQGTKVYEKTDYTSSYYFYDKTNNLFSTGTATNGSTVGQSNYNTQIFIIGHSFTLDDHEFLTDSRFTENDHAKNNYHYYQTFGYKLNFSNKMQFMTGFAHDFESEGNYASVGFSWLTNTLRSTASGYYVDSKVGTQATGVTFGSEFIY